MLEQDAARLIRAQGWKISRGPYINANLQQKGVYVWSIKTVMSAEDLKRRGIKSKDRVNQQRTVRFVGTVKEGRLESIAHLSSYERKKLGARAKRCRSPQE